MFNFPFVVGAGNEKYAPAAFFFATIIPTIFSVAYVQMARKLRAAGGMFTYVSHGLGRVTGMVAGLSLAAAYTLFGASLIGGFAAFAQAKVASATDTDPINWIWYALLGIVGIAALGYFDIPISAKILGVAPCSSLAIIGIFTIGVFGQGGNNGVSIDPVLPWNAFQGIAFGLGIFIAFWSWVGFEAAPNYAEESKNPHRTIPIAVYASCVFVGVLYTLASWASVSSYGPGNEAFDALTAGVTNVFGGELAVDYLNFNVVPGDAADRLLARPRDGDLHHHRRVRLRSGAQQRRASLTHTRWAGRDCCRRCWAARTRSTDASCGRPRPGDHRGSDRPHLQVRRPRRARPVLLDRGSGRDLDHSRPGADVARRLGLLPPPARQRAALVEDHGGALDRVRRPGFVLYLCYKYLSSLAAGDVLYVKELAQIGPWGGFEIDITWLGIIGVIVPVAALAYALFLRSARPAKYETAGRFINEGRSRNGRGRGASGALTSLGSSERVAQLSVERLARDETPSSATSGSWARTPRSSSAWIRSARSTDPAAITGESRRDHGLDQGVGVPWR